MSRFCRLAVVVLIGMAIVVTARSARAQAAPGGPAASAPSGTPKIEFTESKHEFGKVWVGDKLEHTFQVRNTGDAELRILSVKPKCGCTTPSGYPSAIAPGATGEFLFRLVADRYRGDFSTTVDIETNDPANKMVKLTLAGHMQHFIEVTPISVTFDKLRPNESAQTTVKLENKIDKELKLSIKTLNASPIFSHELKEITAGKSFELVVSANPPYSGKPRYQILEITADDPKIQPIRIPCSAIVPERLDVRPSVIYLRPNTPAGPRSVEFTNNSDSDVKLLEAVSDDPAIKVSTVARKPGREYVVELLFPENYVAPSPQTAIVLKTDDLERPEIRIPVHTPILHTRPASRPSPALTSGPSWPERALASAPAAPPAVPQTRPARPATYLVGKPAPPVDAVTFDGGRLRIGGPADRVRLLMFYTSWCGYCKTALPGVEALYHKYKDKGAEVLLVNLDTRSGRMARTEDQVFAHYRELKLNAPMVMDHQQSIGPRYRVTSFPTYVLIGKNGVVEAVHFGANVPFDQTLTAQIEVLLQGKNRADFPPTAVVEQPAPSAAPQTRPASRYPVMELAGKPSPSASVKSLEGKDLKIGSGSGKLQLLAFYASWCGFCKKSMPSVEQIHKDYREKGLEVIAINEDGRSGPRGRTEEQSMATYKEWGLSMPVTMDPEQKLAREFQVSGYPTFFLVGPNGNVEAVYVGGMEVTSGAARTKLDALLKTPGPAGG